MPSKDAYLECVYLPPLPDADITSSHIEMAAGKIQGGPVLGDPLLHFDKLFYFTMVNIVQSCEIPWLNLPDICPILSLIDLT